MFAMVRHNTCLFEISILLSSTSCRIRNYFSVCSISNGRDKKPSLKVLEGSTTVPYGTVLYSIVKIKLNSQNLFLVFRGVELGSSVEWESWNFENENSQRISKAFYFCSS